MSIIAALALGLMGSLHCLGMCGPIAIAIPFSKSPAKRFSGVLVYNFKSTYICIATQKRKI